MDYIFIIGVGMISGFLNVVAAGGSLLTLPLLMFFGLPAAEANATNRIGIFMQNVVSVSTFKKNNRLDVRGGMLLAIPTLLGAFAGAYIAVDMDDKTFKVIIAIIMLVMSVSMIMKPKKWLKGKIEKKTGGLRVSEFIVFFLVGVYGGFIQAGVGLFMLAALVLVSGYNLEYGNPLKVLIIFMYTCLALGVFIYNDLVHFQIGIILGIGSMIGAWLGAKASMMGGSKFIYKTLIVVLVIMSAKMLGVFDSFFVG